MIHFSEPEAKALLEERKRLRDVEWLRGQLGDATYLRSLMILGYSDNDARVELKLRKMESQHGSSQ